jgi:predicted acyl esterase
MRNPTLLAGPLALALLAGVSGPAAAAPEANPVTYQIVQKLLTQFDTNGNETLDLAERAKLEKHVAAVFRARGTQILDAVLKAADADGDRQVTKAEWEALGRRLKAPVRSHTYKVAMSDGVKLATDVFLPPGKGPFPVLLSRTPYGRKRGSPTGHLRAGYAVVKQDMRGRFDSEGENLPFIGCGWVKYRDGADTVAWIRRQPWCNGKIGTMGASAGGITQNLLAAAGPEGLTAQYIAVATASLYHHAAYVGGALRKSQIERWVRGNRFDPNAVALFRSHPTYDEFWHKFDLTRRLAETTAPAVHMGGWFDTFSAGTVAAFVGRQHRGGPGAKGSQKLVMGPWAHGARADGRVGELRFPNSRLPAKYGSGAWFACWLKGADNGAKDLAPVAYYVMGDTSEANAPGNEWRHAADWPIPHEPTAYYLHADGKLSKSPPGEAAGERGRVEYTFDPAGPCPTVGGCNLVLPPGPRNQNRVERRPDVVTFTTDPLAEPVEVTGHAKAILHVSSSAVDTDLSVRFCDVYPNGRSYLMAEGMLRLRFRESFSKPKPLTPGKAVEVTVECWPTSLVVNAGHRMRVTVTSSNYPRFDVNPGTGKPFSDGGRTVKQTNRIHCTRARPSRIVLPVIKPHGREARRGA